MLLLIQNTNGKRRVRGLNEPLHFHDSSFIQCTVRIAHTEGFAWSVWSHVGFGIPTQSKSQLPHCLITSNVVADAESPSCLDLSLTQLITLLYAYVYTYYSPLPFSLFTKSSRIQGSDSHVIMSLCICILSLVLYRVQGAEVFCKL